MGVRCSIRQISPADAEALRSNSTDLESFIEHWQSRVSIRNHEQQLRLFGLPALPVPTIDGVSLEKSWDKIDLLLKVMDPAYDPLSQAILGGEPLNDNYAYKIQKNSRVQAISKALQLPSKKDFQDAFASAEYRAAIAKGFWREDHPNLLTDLGIEFDNLYSMIQDLISIYADAEVCENCLLIEIS